MFSHFLPFIKGERWFAEAERGLWWWVQETEHWIILEKKMTIFHTKKSAGLISDGKLLKCLHFLKKDDSGRNDGQGLRN